MTSWSGRCAARICGTRSRIASTTPASGSPVASSSACASLAPWPCKQDYTIVIVTHNMQQAARIADYTAFFNLKAVGQPGHLEYFADTSTMFNNPQNEEAERYVSGRFG